MIKINSECKNLSRRWSALERAIWLVAVAAAAWYLIEASGFLSHAYHRWRRAIVRPDDLAWVLYFMVAPVVLAIHCQVRPFARGADDERRYWAGAVLSTLRLASLLSVGVALLVAGVGMLASLGVPGTGHGGLTVLMALSALTVGFATIVLALRYFPDFSEAD